MFDNNIGYIYIRTHSSYDSENACKLGKTYNIPERDNQYATGEIKRGIFELVIEIKNTNIDIVEKILQNKFKNYNIRYNAGIEFYNKKIINLVIPYLNTLKFEYKILSKDDINNLLKNNREKINFKFIKEYKNIKLDITKKENNTYKPRDYQIEIINKAYEYYKNNHKGLLIIPCGVGKTLISLWIALKLNVNSIIIGVPNKLLLDQWFKSVSNLFNNYKIKIISSDENTNINNIENFIINNKKIIIITTYLSSFKINIVAKNKNFIFDIKINDETHHLTSNNVELENNTNDTKTYIEMLKIPSIKQLSLTATIKQINNNINNNKIISNDNINYFGQIIDKKSLLWAIKKNIVCDYVIQTIVYNKKNNLDEELLKFNIIDENDKRLFFSAYVSLKSISLNNSHHLLIYSNNKDNSEKIIMYIKKLIENNYFNLEDLSYSNYHSEIEINKQKKILDNYNNSKYGIISCVYCLGEGYDNYKIDGVVFSENMSSNIRIVQSALRASRKNKLEPNKITKIILPIINNIDLLDNNNDLKKIREVIYQMSLEDESISQKIKVLNINNINNISNSNNNINLINDFGEYDEELTNKLKLQTINRILLGITYENAKKIIIENNNIKSKKDYYKLCDIDFRLPKEPDIFFGKKFINWIDYLNIKKEYYNLDDCKKKINEYIVLYPEIKKEYPNLLNICGKLCNIDKLFPPVDLWTYYYNVSDLQEIIIIKKNNKKINFNL